MYVWICITTAVQLGCLVVVVVVVRLMYNACGYYTVHCYKTSDIIYGARSLFVPRSHGVINYPPVGLALYKGRASLSEH